MALFKVRPSRGSWAFFVLITVAAITRRQWSRHEQQVIRRDGPAAESARALATCLFGPNTAWLLREDFVEPNPNPNTTTNPTVQVKVSPGEQRALWAARVGSWLRAQAAGPLSHEWPSRCVAPLDELDQRLLAASQRSPTLTLTIQNVRRILQGTAPGRLPLGPLGEGPAARAAASQIELLKAVDDTSGASLPAQLASLFSDVRDLSLGTRDRWSPFPLRQEQFPMPPPAQVPRWRDVPAAHEQAVLASPTVYFYRSLVDGRTHRVDFDRRSLSDTEVGSAVAWREAPRGGVLRASTEQGGALIPMEPTTRVIALPDEPDVTRRGEAFDWQGAAGPDGLAWLTRTQGTVRLRALRFDEPGRWSEAVTLGAPESQMGAVVAPEALDATRWRVTLLRPRAVDVAVEQHVVAVTPEGLVVTPGPRLAPVVFASVQGMLTCGAEGVRYVALLGARGIAVLRIEGEQLRSAQATVEATWGAEPTLRCDAGRALLVSDPPTMAAAAVVVTFPVGRDPAVETVPPLPYDRGATRMREVLLVDDGLVAVAAHASALRAWRRPLQATRWEPGGYVGSLTPGITTVREVRSLRGVSQGRTLAVWVEGDAVTRRREPVTGEAAEGSGAQATRVVETRAPFRVLMMSEDSGRSFAGR
ncbi:MAG: hypothetical protein Q8S73_05720 [Deltaproteobacteria bacterium]|nr:hypothetical protein [Myxococcales bacterium]MDP3213580.1 hypothetical protein [Deltaproteobacteria bacterium]